MASPQADQAEQVERHFRAFARRPVRLPATVSTRDGSDWQVRLMNLGLGGACLELPGLLQVGVGVTLQVTAPNLWDPLIVPARVAWVRPMGAAFVAGVAFGSPEKGALPALVELLSAYRYE